MRPTTGVAVIAMHDPGCGGAPTNVPRLDPASVRKHQFRQVRRGLDADEVRAFLGSVADHIAALEARIDELGTTLLDVERGARLEAERLLSAVEHHGENAESDLERLRAALAETLAKLR